MRSTPWGIEFTCRDLKEAGVMQCCCPACHGWGEWAAHPAGLVQHILPNGDWVVCCCAYRFSKPDRWLIQRLRSGGRPSAARAIGGDSRIPAHRPFSGGPSAPGRRYTSDQM